jgi:hypothetical protein
MARTMHDSSACPICRGLPIGGSMTDEEFAAFLAACRSELADKQAQFQQRIAGEKTWAYEMADGTLTIGQTCFGMTPIGSFNPERQSWLWGWAHEGYPDLARNSARQIQALYDVTGFQLFRDAGAWGSSDDALDFVALAVHQLDAIGMFRCPATESVIYLAVHAPLNEPI